MYRTGQGELLRVGWVAGPETLGRQWLFVASWAVELARQQVAGCLFCPVEAVSGGGGIEDVYHYAPPRRLTLRQDKRKSLLETLQDVDVDVLHALDESAAVQTVAAGERLHLPYFLSCCRVGARIHLPHKARGLAGVLAVSEPGRLHLLKRRVVDQDAIRLQRPGVRIAPDPRPLEFHDRRAMVLADVYDANTGETDAILRSCSDVRNLDGGALFFLLHSARQERSLRRRAEMLGLLADITFLTEDGGRRSTHVMQSADVFIAAGRRREFDWGALAAMAAGVPVLAKSSNESDFLSDGMTASLFSPGRPDELTRLLANVLTSPEWARAQARSALQYLHVYHNLLRNVTELARLYRAACAPEEAFAPVPVEAENDV